MNLSTIYTSFSAIHSELSLKPYIAFESNKYESKQKKTKRSIETLCHNLLTTLDNQKYEIITKKLDIDEIAHKLEPLVKTLRTFNLKLQEKQNRKGFWIWLVNIFTNRQVKLSKKIEAVNQVFNKVKELTLTNINVQKKDSSQLTINRFLQPFIEVYFDNLFKKTNILYPNGIYFIQRGNEIQSIDFSLSNTAGKSDLEKIMQLKHIFFDNQKKSDEIMIYPAIPN